MPGAATGGERATAVAVARRAFAAALAATGCAALAIQQALGLSPLGGLAAVLVAAAGAAALLRHLPGRHRHPRFGAANAVTVARAVPTVLLVGLAIQPGTVPGAPAVAWCVALAGLGVTLLDGVDGWLARRQRVASEFGARFDMETDSLLVLALALLAWRWDRAGAWVLLSGLARYLFVLAGALAPRLRRPLPPSKRRQAICVLQIAVLLAVIAPVLDAAAATLLALAGLIALAYSFAVDVAWLARRAGHAPAPGP